MGGGLGGLGATSAAGLSPGVTPALAHGVGARHDLPVPLFYALAGGVVAVFVSFLALAVLWPSARFRGSAAGLGLPGGLQAVPGSRALRLGARAVGVAGTGLVAVMALAGPGDPERNPTAGFVYVLFWVGLVPASLLLGPVWRLVNPLRAIHATGARIAGTGPGAGRWRLPGWLGYWPAAFGLLAFTWLELAAPHGTAIPTLLAWFGLYALVQLGGAAAFGSGWFDRCDAFEVYSALIGRLAPLGRRGDGRVVLRNPLDGLDGLTPAPGLVATVCVMLGTTAYDGLSDAPAWVRRVQGSALPQAGMRTLGLFGAVLLVTLLYLACVRAVGAAGSRSRPGTVATAGQFVHSILPVAVGYLIAHYFSLLVAQGPRTVLLAGEWLGAVPPGTAGPAAAPVPAAGAVATIQVGAVVTGHVLGVVAAHDRALRLLPARRAVAGQIPLLVLMLCYTLGGLTLLFAA